MTTLNANIRTSDEKLDTIRQAGKIPAIVYGAGITETVHISLERESFKKAWKAAGGSTAVTLSVDGKTYDALIHDFQVDPKTETVIHADFLVLDKSIKVTVGVELEFIGISPAVKSGTGTLEKMLHEIEVSGLPKDLPKQIDVDISSLGDVHDQIRVSDLKLPTGIVAVTDADDIVAVITGLNIEEESSSEIDFANIEVAKKGKKEESAE